MRLGCCRELVALNCSFFFPATSKRAALSRLSYAIVVLRESFKTESVDSLKPLIRAIGSLFLSVDFVLQKQECKQVVASFHQALSACGDRSVEVVSSIIKLLSATDCDDIMGPLFFHTVSYAAELDVLSPTSLNRNGELVSAVLGSLSRFSGCAGTIKPASSTGLYFGSLLPQLTQEEVDTNVLSQMIRFGRARADAMLPFMATLLPALASRVNTSTTLQDSNFAGVVTTLLSGTKEDIKHSLLNILYTLAKHARFAPDAVVDCAPNVNVLAAKPVVDEIMNILSNKRGTVAQWQARAALLKALQAIALGFLDTLNNSHATGSDSFPLMSEQKEVIAFVESIFSFIEKTLAKELHAKNKQVMYSIIGVWVPIYLVFGTTYTSTMRQMGELPKQGQLPSSLVNLIITGLSEIATTGPDAPQGAPIAAAGGSGPTAGAATYYESGILHALYSMVVVGTPLATATTYTTTPYQMDTATLSNVLSVSSDLVELRKVFTPSVALPLTSPASSLSVSAMNGYHFSPAPGSFTTSSFLQQLSSVALLQEAKILEELTNAYQQQVCFYLSAMNRLDSSLLPVTNIFLATILLQLFAADATPLLPLLNKIELTPQALPATAGASTPTATGAGKSTPAAAKGRTTPATPSGAGNIPVPGLLPQAVQKYTFWDSFTHPSVVPAVYGSTLVTAAPGRLLTEVQSPAVLRFPVVCMHGYYLLVRYAFSHLNAVSVDYFTRIVADLAGLSASAESPSQALTTSLKKVVDAFLPSTSGSTKTPTPVATPVTPAGVPVRSGQLKSPHQKPTVFVQILLSFLLHPEASVRAYAAECVPSIYEACNHFSIRAGSSLPPSALPLALIHAFWHLLVTSHTLLPSGTGVVVLFNTGIGDGHAVETTAYAGMENNNGRLGVPRTAATPSTPATPAAGAIGGAGDAGHGSLVAPTIPAGHILQRALFSLFAIPTYRTASTSAIPPTAALPFHTKLFAQLPILLLLPVVFYFVSHPLIAGVPYDDYAALTNTNIPRYHNDVLLNGSDGDASSMLTPLPAYLAAASSSRQTDQFHRNSTRLLRRVYRHLCYVTGLTPSLQIASNVEYNLDFTKYLPSQTTEATGLSSLSAPVSAELQIHVASADAPLQHPLTHRLFSLHLMGSNGIWSSNHGNRTASGTVLAQLMRGTASLAINTHGANTNEKTWEGVSSGGRLIVLASVLPVLLSNLQESMRYGVTALDIDIWRAPAGYVVPLPGQNESIWKPPQPISVLASAAERAKAKEKAVSIPSATVANVQKILCGGVLSVLDTYFVPTWNSNIGISGTGAVSGVVNTNSEPLPQVSSDVAKSGLPIPWFSSLQTTLIESKEYLARKQASANASGSLAGLGPSSPPTTAVANANSGSTGSAYVPPTAASHRNPPAAISDPIAFRLNIQNEIRCAVQVLYRHVMGALHALQSVLSAHPPAIQSMVSVILPTLLPHTVAATSGHHTGTVGVAYGYAQRVLDTLLVSALVGSSVAYHLKAIPGATKSTFTTYDDFIVATTSKAHSNKRIYPTSSYLGTVNFARFVTAARTLLTLSYDPVSFQKDLTSPMLTFPPEGSYGVRNDPQDRGKRGSLRPIPESIPARHVYRTVLSQFENAKKGALPTPEYKNLPPLADLSRTVFGPLLHAVVPNTIANRVLFNIIDQSFEDVIISDINQLGNESTSASKGLTCPLHTPAFAALFPIFATYLSSTPIHSFLQPALALVAEHTSLPSGAQEALELSFFDGPAFSTVDVALAQKCLNSLSEGTNAAEVKEGREIVAPETQESQQFALASHPHATLIHLSGSFRVQVAQGYSTIDQSSTVSTSVLQAIHSSFMAPASSNNATLLHPGFGFSTMAYTFLLYSACSSVNNYLLSTPTGSYFAPGTVFPEGQYIIHRMLKTHMVSALLRVIENAPRSTPNPQKALVFLARGGMHMPSPDIEHGTILLGEDDEEDDLEDETSAGLGSGRDKAESHPFYSPAEYTLVKLHTFSVGDCAPLTGISGALSPHVAVRSAALAALAPVLHTFSPPTRPFTVETTLVASSLKTGSIIPSIVASYAKLCQESAAVVYSIWVLCHDEDSDIANYARLLWTQHRLQLYNAPNPSTSSSSASMSSLLTSQMDVVLNSDATPLRYLQTAPLPAWQVTFLSLLSHPSEVIRASTSSALPSVLPLPPPTLFSATVQQRVEYFQKSAADLMEFLVNWYALFMEPLYKTSGPSQYLRLAILETMQKTVSQNIYVHSDDSELAKPQPVLSTTFLPRLFNCLLELAMNDPDEKCREAAFALGATIIDTYGPSHARYLLQTIHLILDTINPNAAAASSALVPVKDASIVLIASLTKHLPADDPVIPDVIQSVLATLLIDRPAVQAGISNALPALAKADRTKVEGTFIQPLMEVISASNTVAPIAAKKGAALGIAAVIEGYGLRAIQDFHIVRHIEALFQDGKNEGGREGALLLVEALSERLKILFEPYLKKLLPFLLKSFSDSGKFLRAQAPVINQNIISSVSSFGGKLLLPPLVAGVNDIAWRSKAASITMLGYLSKMNPRQLAISLPQIIPPLVKSLDDAHPNVLKAGQESLELISKVIQNPELASISNVLLDAIVDPATHLRQAFVSLMGLQFKHHIDASSLALLMTILQRGLNDRSSQIKCYAANIIRNLPSLIESTDILLPYLQNIVPLLLKGTGDPIPDVRSSYGRVLGRYFSILGESNLPTVLPSLKQSLGAVGTSVERSGAAQALTEILVEMGEPFLSQTLRSLLTFASSKSPEQREGLLYLFVFLPPSLGTGPEGFSRFLTKLFPVALAGLSDENENVREVAERACRIITRQHAKTEPILLANALLHGLFSPNWRIRIVSISLVGTLLTSIANIVIQDEYDALGNRIGPDRGGIQDEYASESESEEESEEEAVANSSDESESEDEAAPKKGGAMDITAMADKFLNASKDDKEGKRKKGTRGHAEDAIPLSKRKGGDGVSGSASKSKKSETTSEVTEEAPAKKKKPAAAHNPFLEEEDQTDEAIASSHSRALGKDIRNNLLAGLYFTRVDTVTAVRHQALSIWKNVVKNTPKTLREIMPSLLHYAITALSSSLEERRVVGGRCIADITKKFGDRVLSEIIPVLRDAFDNAATNTDIRIGVCIGLQELLSASSSADLIRYCPLFAPVIRDALSDPSSEVNVAGSNTYGAFRRAVGSTATEIILPPLIDAVLEASSEQDTVKLNRCLVGLSRLASTRPAEVVPLLLPQLLQVPISSTHLSCLLAITTSSSAVILKHWNTIHAALFNTLLFTPDGSIPSFEEFAESLSGPLAQQVAQVVGEAVKSGYVSWIFDECVRMNEGVSKHYSNQNLKAYYKLFSIFIFHAAIRQGPVSSPLPTLEEHELLSSWQIPLRDITQVFNDSSELMLHHATTALNSLSLLLPPETPGLLDLVRTHVSTLVSDLKYRMGGAETAGNVYIPAFCISKGLDSFLPLFMNGVTQGDAQIRESAALGLWDMIRHTSDEGLKGYLVKITGPFIRVLADKHHWKLKVTLVDTLSLLLYRGGKVLRPFTPQLQSTFFRCLQEPIAAVRLSAAKAFAMLAPYLMRPEAVFTDLVQSASACSSMALSPAPGSSDAYSLAAMNVAAYAGDKVSFDAKKKALDTAMDLFEEEYEETRVAAARLFGVVLSQLLQVSANTPDIQEIYLFVAAQLKQIFYGIPERDSQDAASCEGEKNLGRITNERHGRLLVASYVTRYAMNTLSELSSTAKDSGAPSLLTMVANHIDSVATSPHPQVLQQLSNTCAFALMHTSTPNTSPLNPVQPDVDIPPADNILSEFGAFAKNSASTLESVRSVVAPAATNALKKLVTNSDADVQRSAISAVRFVCKYTQPSIASRMAQLYLSQFMTYLMAESTSRPLRNIIDRALIYMLAIYDPTVSSVPNNALSTLDSAQQAFLQDYWKVLRRRVSKTKGNAIVFDPPSDEEF